MEVGFQHSTGLESLRRLALGRCSVPGVEDGRRQRQAQLWRSRPLGQGTKLALQPEVPLLSKHQPHVAQLTGKAKPACLLGREPRP